jgi:hypothetical protein
MLTSLFSSRVSFFAFALTTTLCTFAFAQEEQQAQPEPDRVTKPTTNPSPDVQRPWLYNDDPTIPAPMHVVAGISDTYSGNDRSVSRPFASADDGPGAKLAVNAQLGLVKMLALDVTGVMGLWGANNCDDGCNTGIHGSVGGGLMAGLRFAPFDGAKHGFRLAIAAGYLMDLDQSNGFYTRVTATYDVGRLRVAAMLHGEHVFRDGSDPVDLIATAGVSVRIIPELRLGVEYIIQDVEELFVSGAGDADDADQPLPGAAEGGAHQFLGLGANIELLNHRLFLNIGPALAFRVDIGQVQPVGRALVLYSF